MITPSKEFNSTYSSLPAYPPSPSPLYSTPSTSHSNILDRLATNSLSSTTTTFNFNPKRLKLKWLICLIVTTLVGLLLLSDYMRYSTSSSLNQDDNGNRLSLINAKLKFGGINWSLLDLISSKDKDLDSEGNSVHTIANKVKISDQFDTTGETIKINALPRPRSPIKDSDTKYIGFLPHSGFHNQRSALQNALMLGNLLNRTVLVPPIWIGWPTPTQFYDELQQTWTNNLIMNPNSFDLPIDDVNSGLNKPANYNSTSEIIPRTPEEILATENHIKNLAKIKSQNRIKWESKGWIVRPDGFPISDLTSEECKSYSAECRHTYQDTFLAWDFLANLDQLDGVVKVVDRWDMREKSLLNLLAVEEDDIFVFKDFQSYDFQFHQKDTELITPGSSHWKHSISLPALSRFPQKVILFGSLFGSGRIQISTPEEEKLEQFLTTALAFRNPWLMEPAEAIRERLGGGNNFIGIHARVGDGTFLKNAQENMEFAWRRVMNRLRMSSEDTELIWKTVHSLNQQSKRSSNLVLEEDEVSSWRFLDYAVDFNSTQHKLERNQEILKGIKHHLKFKRAPILPLAKSSSLKNLTCRPLYTTTQFLPLNTPIYLATDSRSPTTDPNLSIFFKTFPCTFILSDFEKPKRRNDWKIEESVSYMNKLVNEKDGVKLGRLFLPFLEAIIASMGFYTIGTQGSTFSTFAESGLHTAYHESLP